jgi:hypothetical protein
VRRQLNAFQFGDSAADSRGYLGKGALASFSCFWQFRNQLAPQESNIPVDISYCQMER